MRKIGILIKKEIMEILRDKKTLIIMVLVPLIMYPLLIIGMTLGMSLIMQSEEEQEHIVGYYLEDKAYLQPIEELYQREEWDFEISFVGASAENKNAVLDMADVWIGFEERAEGIYITVDYTSANTESEYTADALEELADRYREELLMANLVREGLSKDFLYPVVFKAVDSATATETVGMSIGGAMGMLLITMIVLGAFYPAVDITTGEKERGTLETLLTLPVTNFQMIMSKYVAVTLFACVTAVVSMISLAGAVAFLLLGMPEESAGGMEQVQLAGYLSSIPMLLVALVTTAMLITALCMCFCIFAKSTKEANNYITPVMLVIMFASMIGMVPSIELNYRFALVPLVNVSLLIKQVFSQQMDIILAGITVLVNMGYSIIVIWILAKMYDSEDILFSDGFRSFRILQKRSDIREGTIPANGDILMCIAVVFLGMIYIGNMVGARNFFASLVVNQLFLMVTPLFVVWYMKSDKKTLFCIEIPKLRYIAGTLITYAGVFCIIMLVSMPMTALFQESTQNMADAFTEIVKQPFIVLVIVVALMPAVGEELLFRGLIFGSLRSRIQVKWAILISALIFGLFHMSLVKFLPTACLGAFLAYIVWRGKSIFLSMMIHFLNNFLSLVAMKYPEESGRILPILAKEMFSVIDICVLAAIGVVCVLAGYIVLNREKRA